MPKARVEDVVANDGSYATVQMEVTERDVKRITQFRKPVTFAAFQELIGTASAMPGLDFKTLFPLTEREVDPQDTEQALYLRLFNSALATWARFDVYHSLSSESTLITIAGEKIDLMSVPLKNLIKGYNNNMGVAEMRAVAAKTTIESIMETDRGFKAWRTAARKLTEGYTDADGVDVKPQAKLVDGELVAL